MKGKKLVALLAAGAMVFSPAGMALGTPLGGMFASTVSAAEADEYLYYNEETGAYEAREIPTTAVSVTANDTRWTEGWYVVDQDITIGSEDAASRVFVDGNVHLVVKDGCDLTVNGGIRVASGDSFTVYAQSTEKEEMGTLTAVELNGNHAAIGGNSNESVGKISLNGGIITVTCLVNSLGAGIGGGNGHDGGKISINGGVVNVYPGNAGSGAGIGGGFHGGSGQIQINNGEITIETSNAESNFDRDGAGIGSGSGASSNADGNIVINNGTINVCHNKTETYGSQSSGAAIGAGAGSNIGNIVINGGSINVSEYAVGIGGNSTVNSNLTGHITINNGEIVARGSSIGIGTNSKSEVNILITNGNVQASGDTGIGGGNKTTIKITGGNIQASATGSGAGIGGLGSFSGRVSLPNIEINGGTIIAKGANIVRTSSGSSPGESAVGAGIGGGALSFSDGDTGTITITGGDITAIGGKKNYWTGGAGIGAGSSGNSGKIVISGGTIEATGYDGAAAIGSGEGVDSNTIVISGGSVTAAAISENTNFGPGAAIGGGYLANSGTVYVSGGVVKATGGKGDQNFPPSAGIGAGSNGTSGNIVISGGTITANGGAGNGYYNDAPAIGSYDGTSGTFSTVLPENGISTLGLLDDASSSRSGNAVVFANGYGSIDRPISDISQQDSWGGLFFLNGEGMMLGQTVKPTDSFILPEGYSFTINQLQTLDLTNILMTLNNTGIYNNGTIINPEGKHLLLINNGGDNIGVIQPDPENPPADLTGLSALVEEAKAAIASGQYTEDSIKELETLIETVENAETLTDEQVKTYISQIQTAMNALKKPVDTSGVDQVISAFEGRTDLDQYTDESVKAVNDLIAEYQSKTGLTQDEIDEYFSKIQTAIEGLRYEIDTTAIDREIEKFNEMTLTNYTAESVKAVRDVIDEYTRAIAAGENLSQNDVDQYLARIQEKVAALEWTSGEHYGGVYDKIRELIQQAYDMLNSGTHYLEDAVAAMNKVIQRAQQVLKIPDLDYRSEEAEIIVYLEDAIDNLENSIDNYYGLDMSAYTNLVRQAEQLEELGYHGPAYNDLWRMINNSRLISPTRRQLTPMSRKWMLSYSRL